MRFSTTSIVTGLLAGIASAQSPADPGSNSRLTFPPLLHRQTSQAKADIASYVSVLQTNSDFLSVFNALVTQPTVLAEIEVYQSAIMNGQAIAMPAPSLFSALPSDQRDFFSSVAVAEISILSKDGITATSDAAAATATGTSTGTATSSAATATSTKNAAAGGKVVRASAGGLLALVAVVLAL
ncbi:hypothetical protein BP5796_07509 [Coleophoma crateriformis]|uniref:FAS1 domain-containing protein n=1 Tax=Coleophoma crateriformis TaxID=565419 RepID=A0A3D8RJ42_9HELO|nr:hypothetical protein BP5796_07509 [Coleophoma crateriformis]